VDKPDLMAELAEVPVVAYAWRKEGMVGWALGHNPPTPNMPDFDKYEVRELTFRTHHAELEAAVRKAARYDWLREHEWNYPIVKLYESDYDNATGDELDNAIDQAMHNSAREG